VVLASNGLGEFVARVVFRLIARIFVELPFVLPALFVLSHLIVGACIVRFTQRRAQRALFNAWLVLGALVLMLDLPLALYWLAS
jgi:hypothetical protein